MSYEAKGRICHLDNLHYIQAPRGPFRHFASRKIIRPLTPLREPKEHVGSPYLDVFFPLAIMPQISEVRD